MSKLFGGSKSVSSSTQSSSNRAFEPVSAAFNPLLGYAQEGASGLSALLGGDATGFNKYKDATGFNFNLERGFDGINSNAASKRMLQSGSAAKSLQQFGTGLQSTYADNYLQKLLGLANVGFGAGNAITGAGSVSNMQSNSKSTSGPGFASLLGPIGSLIAGGS